MKGGKEKGRKIKSKSPGFQPLSRLAVITHGLGVVGS